jgi:MOSC domain-containing protein YiiM
MLTIYSIVYQPHRQATQPTDHYDRVSVTQTQLVADYGIEGDQKGGKHQNRHLNLMTKEILEGLASEGYQTAPGQLGEQIQVTGGDMNAFASGTRLQIGGSAIIELTEARKGCDRFEAVQGQSRAKAAGRLGMMAKVIHSGPIQVGDVITPLKHE